MENIIPVIQQYIGLIIVVIIAIIFGVYAPQKAREFAKQKIIEFMFLAEKKAEQYLLTEGRKKLVWVSTNVYQMLPSYVKFFVPESLFRRLVQQVYDEVMDLIDDGQLNDSYKPPE